MVKDFRDEYRPGQVWMSSGGDLICASSFHTGEKMVFGQEVEYNNNVMTMKPEDKTPDGKIKLKLTAEYGYLMTAKARKEFLWIDLRTWRNAYQMPSSCNVINVF